MKSVAVSQIYIEPGVGFPFSHQMQQWLSAELTSLARDSELRGRSADLTEHLVADSSMVAGAWTLHP
ncbi:MAG TPA: hypothetical protein VM686_36700 [Polyangiaceae bacterium]|nr:hypothetical protein [Polyangiaceae bacterium]